MRELDKRKKQSDQLGEADMKDLREHFPVIASVFIVHMSPNAVNSFCFIEGSTCK